MSEINWKLRGAYRYDRAIVDHALGILIAKPLPREDIRSSFLLTVPLMDPIPVRNQDEGKVLAEILMRVWDAPIHSYRDAQTVANHAKKAIKIFNDILYRQSEVPTVENVLAALQGEV